MSDGQRSEVGEGKEVESEIRQGREVEAAEINGKNTKDLGSALGHVVKLCDFGQVA